MKTLIVIAAMLIVVGCVTFVWAQQQTTPAQPTKPTQLTKPVQPVKATTAEKTSALGGEIVSVDTTANTIMVKPKSGKTETLKIDPKATLKKAGKTISLKDLSPGEKISVSYKTEAGDKIATRIMVKVLPEKKEPTSTKKETVPAPK